MGAAKATALACKAVDGARGDVKNTYSIGHQNSDEQRHGIDATIGAHNADAGWLMWFNPGKVLTVSRYVVQPTETPSPEGVTYRWNRKIAHCTHGLFCTNTGKGAAETTHRFLQ